MHPLPFPHRPPPPKPVQIFSFGPLRFNIDEAKRRAANTAKYTPERRRPSPDWFDPRVPINESHLERCAIGGVVLFATVIIDGWPQALLIDGNHRASKALREGFDVEVVTLDLEDTLAVVSGPAEVLADMRRDGVEKGMLAGE
jgi:hypothetical protein